MLLPNSILACSSTDPCLSGAPTGRWCGYPTDGDWLIILSVRAGRDAKSRRPTLGWGGEDEESRAAGAEAKRD